MQRPHKKSRIQRFAQRINPLEGSHKRKLGPPNSSSIPLSQDQAVKAGLIAGGLAGLTVASVGISALRRTTAETSDS